MILVSIIIVNYRVKFFLEQTIRSAQEAIAGLGGDGEIIVVDNASGDDSMQFIKSRFGNEVQYIENADNVGFARANNQAIAIAKGEFTLILNPDTIIGSDTLSQSIEWFRTHSDCGAVGVRMLDGNGNFLPESKRSFTTPWVSFCKIFGLSALFPKSRIFARYHLRYLNEKQPHKVDILAGAFILAHTSILQKIGGFDERFFMPHSRHAGIDLAQLDEHIGHDLYVLGTSPVTGPSILATSDMRQVFITGHLEYAKGTLDAEYRRDLGQGRPIDMPRNYYPDDDPANEPCLTWRSHANLFWRNWLNYIYQMTPFDLTELSEDYKGYRISERVWQPGTRGGDIR